MDSLSKLNRGQDIVLADWIIKPPLLILIKICPNGKLEVREVNDGVLRVLEIEKGATTLDMVAKVRGSRTKARRLIKDGAIEVYSVPNSKHMFVKDNKLFIKA